MLACSPDRAARAVRGALRFAAMPDQLGVTRLVDVSREAPLQVQRPLYLDAARPGIATVHVLNSTAGLFAGDSVSTSIDVRPGAGLELRTPTMTRVHAMGEGGFAESEFTLVVRDGGYVESMPAPVLLCEAAALRQRTRIDADPAACVAVGEVWFFGRAARGEFHCYRELDARTEAWRAGVLVAAERLALTPADGLAFAATGGLAVYGALMLLGPGVGDLLERIRVVIGAAPAVEAGASMLAIGDAVAVRVLGASAHAVDAVLRAVLREFRERCLPAVTGSIARRATLMGGVR